jgi:hypothetical protein
MSIPEKLGPADSVQCPICDATKKVVDLRGHCGQHILKRNRSVVEDVQRPVSMRLWHV